jgi:hypothetical protein
MANFMGRKKETNVPLEIWLPAFFVLGLVSLGLCVVFTEGCGKI